MTTEDKKKPIVLILYEYFYPGFKAGGPVQSLINLITSLESSYEFKVITTGYDLNESTPYKEVNLDAWNDIEINAGHRLIKVFYSSSANNFFKIYRTLKSSSPQLIYVNGLFGKWGLFLFLLKKIGRLKQPKLIVSPRGMLQQGALSVKATKKRLYLGLVRVFRFDQGITWHATDEQEKADIERIFSSFGKVIVASNIPKPLLQFTDSRAKTTGALNLVFLSLITEKKNLHVALEALKKIQTPISFHIYGPVKDEGYWLTCKRLMEGQVHDIQYRGVVNPQDVQETLSNYHVFVLPTLGENFGHAIYEALSVGTPVLVSPFTPWGRLQDCQAGITIETFNPQDWAAAIQRFIDLNQEEFSTYSRGAYALAKDYFSKNDFKAQYQNLFS